MFCRINKHNVVTSSMKTMNIPSRHKPAISTSPSDRTIVLDMRVELASEGSGILEDIATATSQILYLKSGEIYWLGQPEVMGIQ